MLLSFGYTILIPEGISPEQNDFSYVPWADRIVVKDVGGLYRIVRPGIFLDFG